MASQITHIVLADKLHPQFFSQFPRGLFLLGNVFPDIRTPAHISRQNTHLPVASIADVQAEQDPFIAGIKLHNLIDEVRERYVVKQGAYDLFHSSSFPPTVFKRFEDTELYGKLADWPVIIEYLNQVPPQTAQFGVSAALVQLWHQTLQTYFAHPFSEEELVAFLKVAKPDSAAHAAEVNTIIRQLRTDHRAEAIATGLYDKIENLLPKA